MKLSPTRSKDPARAGGDGRIRVLRVIARLNVGGPAHHVTILSERLDPGRYQSVLLIGDKVVTDAPPEERYPYQMDLGAAWKELTGLPFVYAVWSVPDSDAQVKHFGKVVLKGDALTAYVAWYRGLSKGQLAEWDALIARLHPGPALKRSLARFRFATDPASQHLPRIHDPTRIDRRLQAAHHRQCLGAVLLFQKLPLADPHAMLAADGTTKTFYQFK